ncbi:MAG: family 1 glycosylhydrolase [Candidatus Heimdallarchaeota archaeon]|nr:family 1 glycosylhydrolase [Candidatus Heimdallarchaeota archaeon]
MTKRLTFPKDFLWGCATAAHQIEGGNKNNNWWQFEQEPGRIHEGDTSEVACDHWHRYEEDFEYLVKMNQNSYRLSMEWSRIFPEPSKKDEAAIAHYHQMIDALINRGITPFITLLHFTTPLWWEEDGGLKNQKSDHLAHFREFCQTLVREFGSKVHFWNTINEPNVVSLVGYYLGDFPPGEQSIRSMVRATNTLLKMHTIAYQTLKKIDPKAQVGLVKNINIIHPWRKKSLIDRFLAKIADSIYNASTLKALRTGKLFWKIFGKYPGLQGSYDFLGLNFYSFALISNKLSELMINATPTADPEKLCAGLGWEPYPEGLLLSLRRLQKEFPSVPIYITENGIGTDDDSWRKKVLVDHLQIVHQAIQEGVNVRGYFHWTLMDNFEWAEGYSSRFGLVHVDFETQKRTVKASGKMYGSIAKNNALSEELLEKYPTIYRPNLNTDK